MCVCVCVLLNERESHSNTSSRRTTIQIVKAKFKLIHITAQINPPHTNENTQKYYKNTKKRLKTQNRKKSLTFSTKKIKNSELHIPSHALD